MAKYIAADGTGSPFDLARNFAEVLIKLRHDQGIPATESQEWSRIFRRRSLH